VAAGKPRNVHEAVQPETEALSHETEVRPRRRRGEAEALTHETKTEALTHETEARPR